MSRFSPQQHLICYLVCQPTDNLNRRLHSFLPSLTASISLSTTLFPATLSLAISSSPPQPLVAESYCRRFLFKKTESAAVEPARTSLIQHRRHRCLCFASLLLIVKSRAMHQGNCFNQLLLFANLSQPSPAVVFSFSANPINGVRCCRPCSPQACPVSSTSAPSLCVSFLFRRGSMSKGTSFQPTSSMPTIVKTGLAMANDGTKKKRR